MWIRSLGAGLMVAVLAACGAGSGDDALVVFAAASLTDAFDDVVEAFEAAHPDIDVATSYAGSSSLREQVLAGAPADVVATANETIMDELVAAGSVDTPVVFATNRLTIAVPAGNPGGVDGLDDLARAELLVGLCAPAVPCGSFARSMLDAAGVVASVDTEEGDVRSLVTKVAAGELDAAVVYETDVAADADLERVAVPDDVNVEARYPIAVVADGGDAAAEFVAFVAGAEGQAILRDHGFGAP